MIRAISLTLLLIAEIAHGASKSEFAIEELPALEGAGVEFNLEQLPSSLWPTFVLLKDATGLTLNEGSRGTMIRVDGDQLVVDFGRGGVISVAPAQTDFLESVHQRILGGKNKEFSNLALQIGNKLVRFDLGEESGAIRFEKVESTALYVLLYLDQYSPDLAQELLDFGTAYTSLEKDFPGIIVVQMPKDRTFYDFAVTTGYNVPMITPHTRIGYINSLSHDITQYPAFVVCDANGKVLGMRSGLEWALLAKELEKLLEPIGIPWQAPDIKHRNWNTRLTPWLR